MALTPHRKKFQNYTPTVQPDPCPSLAEQDKYSDKYEKDKYQYGTPLQLLYPVRGSSMDFAHELGVNFSMTIEISPGVASAEALKNPFHLPTKRIKSSLKEIWAGLKAVLSHLWYKVESK